MAERVDAVAVDVRDRAGAAELQIAADEHDADRVARLERALERLLAGVQPGGAAAGRDEALVAERAAEHVGELRLEARHHERRRDRTEQRAELRAADAGHGARRPMSCASFGRSANGRFQFSALRNAAVEALARQRELDLDARAPAAGRR